MRINSQGGIMSRPLYVVFSLFFTCCLVFQLSFLIQTSLLSSAPVDNEKKLMENVKVLEGILLKKCFCKIRTGRLQKAEELYMEEINVLQKELKAYAEKCEARIAGLKRKSVRDENKQEHKQENKQIEIKEEIKSRHEIPVLVFCYNRAGSLDKTLNSLLEVRSADKHESKHPIYVSQDGDDAAVAKVIESHPVTKFQFKFTGVKQIPGQQEIPGMKHYYKIASHYEFALGKMFEKYDRVIIVEDDMKFAPDFFNYFRATSALVEKDPSIYCVSAWNDNGVGSLVSNPSRLYRTDCFPGLGWMMHKRLWQELGPKWASGFWDDWMREPPQRKDRSCIRPEINRVYTFGNDGVSGGQFFAHLEKIRLNTKAIEFEKMDLSYLLQDQYDEKFTASVRSAKEVSSSELDDIMSGPIDEIQSDLRCSYNGLKDLDGILMRHGLMTDHKAGVPRTAYRGVVTFSHGPKLIYLYPASFL